jgi:two-component system chemotaxis response regulator CheY
MRSLIVDDSPIIRRLLEQFLTPYGECVPAKNGRDALEAHSRGLSEGHPYDLICLDLQLPDLGGIEVLSEIRAAEARHGSTAKARVIVITASDDVNDVNKVKDLGADGYLLKPVSKQKLLDYVAAFRFAGGPVEK